jgi:molybdopterin-guanine dinucleotide biosynthesis protein A
MSHNTQAIILAGGRATRMGGIDKGLLEWQGRPLVSHVIERIAPQVDGIIISANRNLDQYGQWGHRVVSDQLEGFQGPLAGLVAAGAVAQADRLLISPCDTPNLPVDLCHRLNEALNSQAADIAIAHDGQRSQQLCMLLQRRLLADALAYLQSGERRVISWVERHTWVEVDFSDCAEAFHNLNRNPSPSGSGPG